MSRVGRGLEGDWADKTAPSRAPMDLRAGVPASPFRRRLLHPIRPGARIPHLSDSPSGIAEPLWRWRIFSSRAQAAASLADYVREPRAPTRHRRLQLAVGDELVDHVLGDQVAVFAN